MPNRSWFFASQGQQQGPFPEAQFREFVARGTVRADTLVWTEGMAGWQKAGEIPGLMSSVSRPPAAPGRMPPGVAGSDSGSLSIEFGIWEFVWRSLVFFIGILFVIPFPWVFVMYCKWLVSCTHVPGRPPLSFTGQPLTILWWYLGAIVLLIVLGATGLKYVNALAILVQFGLYWLAIRWVVANIASNGEPLGLSFSGSYWGYLGWNILALLSVITIVGWAWVYTAQLRWICRHIEGTRREVVFEATGLQYLWRAIVVAIACSFIIPIPWALRWIMRWQASQIVLVEGTARATA
jgi:heme/copper-type cytochrome/quinol oxidase subunit 2